MPRPAYSAAIFDLDGTLVDSLPDLIDASRLFLSERSLPTPSDDAIRAMVGDGVRRLVERLLVHAAPEQPQADLDAHTARFMELYAPRASRLTRPFPYVSTVLHDLRKAGVACAVCTNKPLAPTLTILEALNLRHYFRTVIGGDSTPARKPDPQPLLAALDGLGASPRDAVMIGDHHNDMEAARRAGTAALFATWGYGKSTVPQPEVVDMNAVRTLILANYPEDQQ